MSKLTRWMFLLALGSAGLADVEAGNPVLKPESKSIPRPNPAVIARPKPGTSTPRQISGPATVGPDRSRIGITAGTGTNPFPSTPNLRRPDNVSPYTRRMGDNTVSTQWSRPGINRGHSTGMFGSSSHLETPRVMGRSGLSTQTSYGRMWSGFRRVK